MVFHGILKENVGNLSVDIEECINEFSLCVVETRMEIATLTSKRDFLEENEELMGEQQLLELVRQHVRLVLTKMLVDDGRARADRRKKRLEKLQNLRTLARERGHGHSDLLCMLMQLQLRRLREIVDFVADGRHYLETEYRLSSMRCVSILNIITNKKF